MEISPETLKSYCDNSKAYGWEIGRGKALTAIVKASKNNPFVRPDWEKNLVTPEGGNMFKNAFAFIAGGVVALAGVVLGTGIKTAAKEQK